MDNSNVIEGTAVPVTPASNLNLAGVAQIPAVRQVVLLLGIAVAVAAGFAIASWSQTPGYTQLYSGIEAGEAADIVDALRAADIDYKLNSTSGEILVPQESLHSVRMQLAGQGFSGSSAVGMDGLGEKSSFGTSQFMEAARYQHALEAELARTISSLGSVREARVHLALPKQTSFIRDQKSASASILLQLYRGGLLEADQAAAIVNLVAASVPNLLAKNVTLVDQNGSLLSTAGQRSVDAQASSQFKYMRLLEENYKTRIEELLTPLVGAGRVRAEVVADVDFTMVEETRESFDPNRSVVRSEQTSEDLRSGGGSTAAGVPGALSNQPPEAGGIENVEAGDNVVAEEKNTSRSSTRNYEIDRTISHTRPNAGQIRKLSVAVLIDESPYGENSEGLVLGENDLSRYTALVKEAVGFSDLRGDSVVVMGQAFLRPPVPDAAEPPAFWEKPVMRDTLKQVLGAILVLAIAFGIVRPMLRGVMAGSAAPAIHGEYLGSGQGYAISAAVSPAAAGGGQLPMPNYNEKVAAAKNMSGHDPARVAEVVKRWVASDD